MKKLLLAASIFVASSAFAATSPSDAKYGGNCAYGMSVGKVVSTDCSITWADPATKATYCFLNEQNKAEWAKNVAMNQAKADAEFAKTNALKAGAEAQNNALNQAADAIKQADQAVNQANQAVNQAQGLQGAATH